MSLHLHPESPIYKVDHDEHGHISLMEKLRYCSHGQLKGGFQSTLNELIRIGTFETATLAHEEEADFIAVCFTHGAAGVLPFHLCV